LTNAALRALRRILRAADRAGRRLATATGMTPSQLLILQEVQRLEETTPTIIASTLQFAQPTVTSIVERLAGAGYLTRERGETDRRKIYLRVTEAGRAALAEALGAVVRAVPGAGNRASSSCPGLGGSA